MDAGPSYSYPHYAQSASLSVKEGKQCGMPFAYRELLRTSVK